MAAGSFLNGVYTYAPLSVFLVGRMMAGVGAGLVIYFAPRLLDIRWENPTSWASILLPVAGPAVIAGASMLYGWSSWEWGFLMEGACRLAQPGRARDPRTDAPSRLLPLPDIRWRFSRSWRWGVPRCLYCLHWGQLHGWLESLDIVVAVASGTLFLVLALFLVYPQLDFARSREGWIRLLLFFFGGVVQFFHGTTMTIYSGMFVNFSPWQRSWLVWSMPLGVATSLLAARLAMRRWRISLGLPGAIVGLLILAGGMFSLHETTLEWPYWQIQNVVDLNWFPAPQHWELAPGRFLVGLGLGLFMFAMDTMFSPDPEREETIRPFLLVTQFFGGAIGMGLLISFPSDFPPDPVFVRGRPGLHPGGRVRRAPGRTAGRAQSGRGAGARPPGRGAPVPRGELRVRQPGLRRDLCDVHGGLAEPGGSVLGAAWSGTGSVRLPGRRPRDARESASSESTLIRIATDEKQSGSLDILDHPIH